MKMIQYILMLSLTCIMACEDEMPHIDPPPVEVKIFELQWATKLDIEKELVSTDNTQQFDDWVIVGGDIGDPPIIKAFNKSTGEMDWEYIHQGSVDSEIDESKVFDNIYLGVCSDGIVAVDMQNQVALWEIDFGLYDYDRFAGSNILGAKLYQKVIEDFGTAQTRVHLLEIDVNTGDFMEFVSYGVETALMGISPPVFFQNEDGKDIMIFNQYPDIELPQDREQNITAMDINTKEVLWLTENFTEGFASNGGYPPIIYEDMVITGGDWSIYAFDILTGEQRWKTPIAPEAPFGNWNNTNHLIQGNRLYVNDTGNHLTCLDPITGDIIWDSTDAPNCTDNMLYYEKEDYLVFTSWGNGSVMILDALTGETIHREHRYDNSQYNNDVVYDKALDMFFTSTYKHAIGFKINATE